jgi:hypothetical protein
MPAYPFGSVRAASDGSVTSWSRSQPSFSSLRCWIATALAFRVQVGQRLELRRPAAVERVGDRELPGLVVDLEDDVLAEVLERDLGARPGDGRGAGVPDLVGPLLELDVVGDATLKRDRLVLGPSRRPAAARRVAAVAAPGHLGASLERAGLADPGYVAAVPLHAELEVLVRVEALRTDAELDHRLPASPW